MDGRWSVHGYDTFSSHPYNFLDCPEEGFGSEDKALVFARTQFAKIQRDQPPEEAGDCWDEGSIQDRVVIVRPDGSEYYYEP